MNNNSQPDWYADKKEVVGKYPIIWNTSKCEIGECKDDRTVHRWSLPFTSSCGLIAECYDCRKTMEVRGVWSDLELWKCKQGEWAINRMKELAEYKSNDPKLSKIKEMTDVWKGVTSSNE